MKINTLRIEKNRQLYTNQKENYTIYQINQTNKKGFFGFNSTNITTKSSHFYIGYNSITNKYYGNNLPAKNKHSIKEIGKKYFESLDVLINSENEITNKKTIKQINSIIKQMNKKYKYFQ